MPFQTINAPDAARFYDALRIEVRRLLRPVSSAAAKIPDAALANQAFKPAPLTQAEQAVLSRALRQQAEAFTSARARQVQSSLAKPDQVAAYLAYYSVRSFALARIFAQNYDLDASHILDIGAGPGSAGIALRFGKEGSELDVIEPAKRALQSIQELCQNLGLSKATQLGRRIEDSPLSQGRYTTVLAFFSLNEWPADLPRRAQLVTKAYQALRPGGTLCIVEPALRETARELSSLRELLLEAGLQLIGPCTHQNPCPMLQRRRDYCHGRVQLELPEDFVALGQKSGGFDLNDSDFSSLIFRAPFDPSQAQREANKTRTTSYRVVGDPRHEKGRVRLFACGAPGLVELSALTRKGAQGVEALTPLQRGDEILVHDTPNDGRLRITDVATISPQAWRP